MNRYTGKFSQPFWKRRQLLKTGCCLLVFEMVWILDLLLKERICSLLRREVNIGMLELFPLKACLFTFKYLSLVIHSMGWDIPGACLNMQSHKGLCNPLNHMYHTLFGLSSVFEWFAGVYTSIKSMKINFKFIPVKNVCTCICHKIHKNIIQCKKSLKVFVS